MARGAPAGFLVKRKRPLAGPLRNAVQATYFAGAAAAGAPAALAKSPAR